MEKELHEKMEFAWKSIKLLKDCLDLDTTDLKCSFGNYVKINGEWKKQNYPIPTFFIKDIGEVGYDFDTFYLVVAIEKISIKEEFIEDLLEIGYNVSIYGSKNLDHLFSPLRVLLRKDFINVFLSKYIIESIFRFNPVQNEYWKVTVFIVLQVTCFHLIRNFSSFHVFCTL